MIDRKSISYPLWTLNPLSLSPKDRIENYNKRFPDYDPIIEHNNKIYGFWLIGRWYASDTSLYGSYPPSYLRRIMTLFPDCYKILHLFSGTLIGDGEYVTTYDINPGYKPNICDDTRNLLNHFESDTFELILADPPYQKRDFEVYKCKPFNKPKVVKDCSLIIKEHGFLVWMDTIMPTFSKEDWNLAGAIALLQSTNHRIRIISIFQKGQLAVEEVQSTQLDMFAQKI